MSTLSRTAGTLFVALLALPLAASMAAPVEDPQVVGEQEEEQAAAAEPEWQFSTSLTAEPLYEAGFPHFDYVNPDAPKGGRVRLSMLGGYDTFNPIHPLGQTAAGLGLVFETLMISSLDEDTTQYPLIAEAFRHPDDYSWVAFRLNPDARWHDGEPITVEDVVWSFEKLVEHNPSQAHYYANVVSAEITGEREVTFRFDEVGNRELPHIMGQLIVLPKHWWEGVGANGQPRNIGAALYEPPLGSGPYRLASFIPGRSITYTRVEDAWATDLPVNVGHYNFDQFVYEFFRDTTVMFEAFKADEFDWWSENVARRWALEYDFPAVQDGRVVRELFENPYRNSGVMVGFIPNLRKEIFQDPVLRQAIAYAFDFEELNRTIFYEQYERVESYFHGTELASSGLPEGLELQILEEVRDLIPESVFTQPNTLPVGGNPDSLRDNLRTALAMLTEAGYRLEGNRLLRPNGQPVAFEILLDAPTIEAIALHFRNNLAQIGIQATIRIADSAQYTNRLNTRDYDMIYNAWAQSLSPGNEQRNYWGSWSAEEHASGNYAGISDPGIDRLIERLIFAEDRETLVAATRALDRVLLANHYVVPSYTLSVARTARWDRFGHPEELPYYSIGFPTIWWWDP